MLPAKVNERLEASGLSILASPKSAKLGSPHSKLT
jgi:hypothetical protein